MNRDITSDRNWTQAKEYLESICIVINKIQEGIELTDADLTMTKYGLLLVSCELKRRRCEDAEEVVRLHDFGVDTPPAS